MPFSVGVFAQYSAGDFTIQPKVGLNCSSLTEEEAHCKAGFVGGIEGEYHYSPSIGVSIGVLYSMQGAKDSEIKLNMNYVNIPILANFYIAKGFALKAGIQPAFNVSNKVKIDGVTIDYDQLVVDVTEGTPTNKVSTFDLAIPIGASCEYKNVVLDARYNIGVYKVETGGSSRNSVFQLTLGYKFKL